VIGQREGWPRRFYRVVGGCRACRRLRYQHSSNETEALARQCFDEALFMAGIANRAPGSIQAGRQRCIGYAAPIPNGFDEFVFADDALPVADQVIQQIEHLWRDGDDLRPAMQLAPVSVECVLLEEIAQAAIPLVASDRRGFSTGAIQRISRR
jgi:hypothetical protein